jgi:carbonic anhydrase
MKDSRQLLLANKAWSTELLEEDANFFSRQTTGQRPKFLWIGCSDSRVGPEQMTQSQPGAMFIHRNVANLIDPDDLNLMSVLQYAVDVLQVPNILVVGHHGCGGIKATLAGGVTGPVDKWLNGARKVLADHREEIDAQPTEEEKVNRLVEVNVRDQLIKLAHTDTIQGAFARGQKILLHGWVYDIRDGLLKPLMQITDESDLAAIERPEKVL